MTAGLEELNFMPKTASHEHNTTAYGADEAQNLKIGIKKIVQYLCGEEVAFCGLPS